MNITVYCGSQFGADPIYQEKAKELGHWIGTMAIPSSMEVARLALWVP